MEKAFIVAVKTLIVFYIGAMIYVETVYDLGMGGTTSLQGITLLLVGPFVLALAALLFGFIKAEKKTTKIIFIILIMLVNLPPVWFCYTLGLDVYEKYNIRAVKIQKLGNWIDHAETLTYSSESFGISFSYASIPKSWFKWIPEGSINDGVIGETIVTESSDQIVVLLKYNDPMFESLGKRYDVIYRFIKIRKAPNISMKAFLNSYVCNLVGPGDIHLSQLLLHSGYNGMKHSLKLPLHYDYSNDYEGGCEQNNAVETYRTNSDLNEKYYSMEPKFSGVYDANKGISLSKEDVDGLVSKDTVFIEYPNNTGDILVFSGWTAHGFGPVEGSLGIDTYSSLANHMTFNK